MSSIPHKYICVLFKTNQIIVINPINLRQVEESFCSSFSIIVVEKKKKAAYTHILRECRSNHTLRRHYPYINQIPKLCVCVLLASHMTKFGFFLNFPQGCAMKFSFLLGILLSEDGKYMLRGDDDDN